jgi:hypothetical protein
MKERGKNLIRLLLSRKAPYDSSGARDPTGVHVWERWHRATHYAFYGLLTLSAVLALSSGPINGAYTWGWAVAVCGLTLLFGGWYWITVAKHPEWCQQRPLPVLGYFGGAAALFAGLTYLHPAYMFMLFILYWHVYSL